jgi:hypothetical protein
VVIEEEVLEVGEESMPPPLLQRASSPLRPTLLVATVATVALKVLEAAVSVASGAVVVG